MLLKEYRDTIEDITKTKVTNISLATILGTTPQNISKRIKNNSVLTTLELTKLEETYGIFSNDLYARKLYPRKKQYKEEFSSWGTRLHKIQMVNNLSDDEMADILHITKEQLEDIICNETNVPIGVLQNVVENFNINLNWLLLADNHNSSMNTLKMQEVQEKKPILTPDFNIGVQYEFDKWGRRLLMLQVQSGMLDSSDFAKFLDIPERDLDKYIMDNKYPKGEHLLKIKTRFSKTNINWLLFGEN